MKNVIALSGSFALCGLCAAVPARAQAQDELTRSLEELRAEVEAQQETLAAQQSQIESQATEIDDLRKQVPVDWLTEERAEEIRGLVTEVLADADTRASLLQGGASAGHDGKSFFIGSPDGNFLLKIGGQIQPRYIYNSREAGATGSPAIDEDEYGFQIRRVKLWFDGHVYTPDLTYKIQMAADRDTGVLAIEEGWINYKLGDQIKVFAGRFADPLLRDSFTSNARQMAVERSITSYIFAANDNYTEGFGADWRPADPWRIRATVNDGIGSGNPGGTGNDFQNDTTDFATTGRADWKLAGEWKQMDDCASWSGEPFAAFIGAAIHYEVAETGDGQASGTMATVGPYDDFIVYTLDGSIESGGLSIYAAGIGQHITTTDSNPLANQDNYGFVAQAGLMIVPDKLEPFARYEYVDIESGTSDVSVLTAGFNYYWRGNAMKFSADVVYCLDPLTAANTLGTSLTAVGLLTDNPGAEDQVAVRAQFQLLF